MTGPSTTLPTQETHNGPTPAIEAEAAPYVLNESTFSGIPFRSNPQTDLTDTSPVSVSTLTFLGTGTSSQVPAIGCLTNPNSRCRICPSALHTKTQKNRRRNTSAFITLSNDKTILIDCGKSFFDAALQIWPRAGFRKIDALLLTHAHADAINGLDDLRGWTLGGFIQKSISVYCSRKTYDAVSTTFPYMVDSAKATGGGDIPAFSWNVIDEDDDFFIPSCGVNVRTLPVEHGFYFDAAFTPFVCLGFQIGAGDDKVSYISDASSIPQTTKESLEGSKVLVLDALKWGRHASHMCIDETLDFIREMERGAERVYLVDFTHEVDHYSFETQLRDTMDRDVRPAFDGLMVKCGKDDGLKEIDLLAAKEWIAVSEREGKTNNESREANGKLVKTLV